MRINKKHKLYFRDKTQAIRRLDKAYGYLYMFIIDQFIRGAANELYAEKNKDVKIWQDWKAIDMYVPRELEPMLESLKKDCGNLESVTISYNSDWRPLVTLKIDRSGKLANSTEEE